MWGGVFVFVIFFWVIFCLFWGGWGGWLLEIIYIDDREEGKGGRWW